MTEISGHRRRWAALAVALLCVGPGHAAETLHVIELKHRPAAELAPAVRPLLRSNEALSATDYRLIVRTSDTRREEIERLVRRLDVARRQLTITVRHAAFDDEQRAGHAARGEVDLGDSGRVVLRGPATDPSGAATIRRDRLEYQAQNQSNARHAEQTQTMRVLDGATAYIRAGQAALRLQRILALSGKSVLHESVSAQDLAAGFAVRPQVRGESVRLDVTPRVAARADPTRGLVDFEELRTTVEARLGEWIDLGSILDTRSEINRAILAGDSDHAAQRRTILLKVE